MGLKKYFLIPLFPVLSLIEGMSKWWFVIIKKIDVDIVFPKPNGILYLQLNVINTVFL